MKKPIYLKLIYILLALFTFRPNLQCDHDGGAAVAGAIGGFAAETMVDNEATQSTRSDNVEENIQQEQKEHVQEKTQELERELERAEFERKVEEQRILAEQMEKERASTMHILLISLIFILGLALAGLGIAVILKNKP